MMDRPNLKYMSNIVFLDHEIVSLPSTGGILCGHQTALRNWVIITVAFRYLQWYLLGDMNQDGICPSV